MAKKGSGGPRKGARPTPRDAESAGEPASYMGHLTRERLLEPAEELALATLVRAGDTAARSRLIEANMRLVISIAKTYRSSLVPLEDLVQEGAIGLVTACERFDPTRGFRFSTYATHWIRQSICRAIDNKSRTIRVPAHISEQVRRLERVRSAMTREDGEEPTIEQLSERIGVPVARLLAYMHITQGPLSLDMLVGDDDNTVLSALLADPAATDPEAVLLQAEMQRELDAILATLSDRERRVVRRRLGMENDSPCVLQQIGDEMHVTRERVRQIESQALRRLRSDANRRRLRDILFG